MANLKEFGQVYNGEGELHFPKIRVVSIHHMQSGVAAGLAIGSYYQSETTLAAELVKQLPEGSTIVADRFFDKPTFLEIARQNKVHVVVRLKDAQAKKLLGDLAKTKTAQRQVVWSRKSKFHPQNINICGNVFKFTAEPSGFRSSEFYFFSTAQDLTLEQVADLYRKRVRVETFIRQLKQTLKMFFIKAKKAQNVKKEIYIAYLTFNLLRAVMQLAAQLGNFESERMSFTAAINLTKAYASAFLKAKSNAEIKNLTSQFVTHMGQTKLPKRHNNRSYPRVIKYPRDKYPKRGIVKVYSDTKDCK